jgi:uncharacterized protein YdaU (DUF1376 family)
MAEQKVYMPLMIGDWLKGTRGMKAEVRGVYLSLLLYQWDNGFVPTDWEELCLIDPELPKVWDKLKSKFEEFAPGKMKNLKNEEVKDFWAKQRKNGGKGGRPKKNNPEQNPDNNPNENPTHNLHNDLDIEYDIESKNKKESVSNSDPVVNVPREADEDVIDETLKNALDEIYLDQQRLKWPHIDFDFEYRTFCEKVRGSPSHYRNHDTGGMRLAFQSQLRNAKRKPHAKSNNKNDRSEFITNEMAIILAHASGAGKT